MENRCGTILALLAVEAVEKYDGANLETIGPILAAMYYAGLSLGPHSLFNLSTHPPQ